MNFLSNNRKISAQTYFPYVNDDILTALYGAVDHQMIHKEREVENYAYSLSQTVLIMNWNFQAGNIDIDLSELTIEKAPNSS